ncbi:MAG: substrate-binding domain-containing protein [Verrucomicrobiae bacterium]|nr:substrate-binding domain-containing protein [Verrucomicrobiae bacterium]NNJ86993.1 substrate-binding domain-containing protein [Akkermansiaceae bacterium]
MPLNLLSRADQVAIHLREEILSRRWKEYMPGVAHLQSELGVNHVTINAALHILEQQGLIQSQGRRRRRKIVSDVKGLPNRSIRIRILPYDPESRNEPYNLSILGELNQAGFESSLTRKSLRELGMNPARIAKYVRGVEADAWIVSSGSPEVLEWFAGQSTPAMALFGASSKIQIAGTSVRKSPVMSQLVHDLVELGHHLIVMLTNRERLEPEPWLYERNFLQVMKECGVATSRFNLPIWEPSREGLLGCIDSLFQHTPPTALIVEEPQHLIAAQQHLASKGILAPKHVSLICGDPDPSFAWCKHPVTHIRWDIKKIVNRVVRWARNVSVGKEDMRKSYFNSELVEGNTIGPPAS